MQYKFVLKNHFSWIMLCHIHTHGLLFLDTFLQQLFVLLTLSTSFVLFISYLATTWSKNCDWLEKITSTALVKWINLICSLLFWLTDYLKVWAKMVCRIIIIFWTPTKLFLFLKASCFDNFELLMHCLEAEKEKNISPSCRLLYQNFLKYYCTLE